MKKIKYFILATICSVFFASSLLGHWLFTLPPAPVEEAQPSWSPNGQELAYTCYLNGPVTGWSNYDIETDFDGLGSEKSWANYTDEASDICLANRDGSNFRHLVQTYGADLYPAWSPDGTQIAYTHKDLPCLIYLDGTRSHCFTLNIKVEGALSWSSQGDKLLFTGVSNNDENESLFWLNVKDGSYKNLTEGRYYYRIFWSRWVEPGASIFFVTSNNYRGEFTVRAVDEKGQREKVLYEPIHKANIFPLITGEVYFEANFDYMDRLYKITPNELKPILVETGNRIPVGISPRGKYAMYAMYIESTFMIVEMQTGAVVLEHKLNIVEPFFENSYNWSHDENYLALTVSNYLGMDNKTFNTQYESHIYIFDIPNKTVHRLVTH